MSTYAEVSWCEDRTRMKAEVGTSDSLAWATKEAAVEDWRKVKALMDEKLGLTENVVPVSLPVLVLAQRLHRKWVGCEVSWNSLSRAMQEKWLDIAMEALR